MRIAIAGDLHGSWSKQDLSVLLAIKPDAVLFVGDLGEADLRQASLIKNLPFPTAVILGNHDRGNDRTGEFLETHLRVLGDLDCGWSVREWPDLPLAVVGGRPCSSGGGFYLSPEVVGVFGPITLEESASRIANSADSVPSSTPLVILAHSGPTGLGSEAFSPCGRDWKSPSLDWGDKDLELAIDKMRKKRKPDLVVFGHMHHDLRKSNKTRITFIKDSSGISYLNTACVPRRGNDTNGKLLTHFSWVEFSGNRLVYASHRWFHLDASIAYEELLLKL